VKPWIVDGLKMYAWVCTIVLACALAAVALFALGVRFGPIVGLAVGLLLVLGLTLFVAYLGRKKETNDDK